MQQSKAAARTTAALCAALFTTHVRAQQAPAQGQESAMSEVHAIPCRIGGTGGVYFYPPKGDFVVEVQRWKRRPEDEGTHVHAVLFGPDRTVLHDALIPGPGGGDPAEQRVRLSTRVEAPGVYGLAVTIPEDRYGEYTYWGFWTNSPRYIVETSRGHRDRRHEEPLVLASPEVPGDLCFMPRAGAFSIDLHGVPAAAEPVTLCDGAGSVLGRFTPDAEGKVHHTVPGAATRDKTPWRIHLPKCKTVAEIDGVTRWESDDLYRDMALWTPDAGSWFPFPENRWLLEPYHVQAFGAPGQDGEATFTVHNNETTVKAVTLALEFPDGAPWPAALSSTGVTVPPRASVEATLKYRVPAAGDAWQCRLRATPDATPDFTTYSTVHLRRGAAPATRPLQMPIVLKPYAHENAQFGYVREYPVDQEMYTDSRNRPYVVGSAGLHTLRDGAWCEAPFAGAAGAPADSPVTAKISKVAFDRDDNAYLIVKAGGQPALRCSADQGRTSSLSPISGDGAFDIEQFSGHNVPDGPPPFIRVTRTATDPKLIWRSLNDLTLFVPRRAPDGSIAVGEPILVSRKCIGLCSHSGIPSFVVSRGTTVHVAWAEATDPAESVPGVPTYVATYDRSTGILGKPVLIGYGPPANDVHNSPCITMDSKGYLHVIVGTHGRIFKYARSQQPNDAYAGWTATEDVGKGLSQTYVGLVCDRDDTLHLVFRLWLHDPAHHPFGSHATLAHMTKRPGQPWSEPRVLVVAAFANYSIFYHRLTIDHRGRLLLSYDYWSTYWFYRNDQRQRRRRLLLSPDGGNTWKLATQADLAAPTTAR